MEIDESTHTMSPVVCFSRCSARVVSAEWRSRFSNSLSTSVRSSAGRNSITERPSRLPSRADSSRCIAGLASMISPSGLSIIMPTSALE